MSELSKIEVFVVIEGVLLEGSEIISVFFEWKDAEQFVLNHSSGWGRSKRVWEKEPHDDVWRRGDVYRKIESWLVKGELTNRIKE